MTRDSGLRDDQPGNDADIYAALRPAFPRLPGDAPNEIKDLTIDIHDPKRVYVVHRASRRHNFQILVERFNYQVRYGCQNGFCTTSSCFSYRKRFAAGAPVRRYNATSARTLAVYLASQDNPEQALCHNPSAERPVSQFKGPYNVSVERAMVGGSESTNDSPGESEWQLDGHAPGPHVQAGELPSVPRRGNDGNGATLSKRSRRPIVNILDENPETDHKSFVQNVFNTVAFKMLEWLTPQSLETLRAAEDEEIAANELVSPLDMEKSSRTLQEQSKEYGSRESIPVSAENLDPNNETSKPSKSHRSSSADTGLLQQIVRDKDAKSDCTMTSVPHQSTIISCPSSPTLRVKADSAQHSSPRGIVSVSTSPKSTSSTTDMKVTSRETPHTIPYQKSSSGFPSSNQDNLPKAMISRIDDALVHARKDSGISSPAVSDEAYHPCEEHLTDKVTTKTLVGLDTSKNQPKKARRRRVREHQTSPKSLSCLSVEVINYICDVLQNDHTFEHHSLYPETIEAIHQKHRDNQVMDNTTSTPGRQPPHDAHEWRMFIEQSLFGVLSNPEALLASFNDHESSVFDTQTLWYLMLRLTRVTPSVVFDSLWITAGALFQPHVTFEGIHDRPKETLPHNSKVLASLSDLEAAEVINICLHALVAAAPLVSNPRQLADMSRIRSYGWTMLGQNMTSPDLVAVCLQYDDAFSNDLALRLARRLFAAIPTRRRFTELHELQRDVRFEDKFEPDILEIVISMIKVLDTPTMLNFEKEERDIHEKRIPILILDWARTVMFHEWRGTAEVPSDGPFGGALAIMAAMHKNRKSLLLGDIHFQTEYFGERLDSIETPVEWASFESNKRTVNLLDYPYLFSPSSLITYFRAINFSRMNQAYDTSKAKFTLMEKQARENTLLTDEGRRNRLYERLRTSTTRYLALDIRRNYILQDTFDSIWRREERELMRPLKVRLGMEAGEEGLDSGGVQQEFFRLAIAEALNPDYGAFTVDQRTQMTWFRPGSPEPLWKFELIGMIISLAVYNGLTLPITFPKAFYRKLLGKEISELHHISDGWPDLANGLTTLLEWDESEGLVEDIFGRTYEFSVEQFGEPISREMGASTQWPQFNDVLTSSNPTDAPLVTNENRNSYVSDYIRWLTDISVRPQFEALKTGFFTCIDHRSIKLFNAGTLQSVIEGVQEIDITELRRATRYDGGWDSSHPTVRNFWSVVKKFDLAQRKKLLEFVTASERIPVGGMRNIQFVLQKNGGQDDESLPRSYTCYGILLLPEYPSKEMLKQKLTTALQYSQGFGQS